MGALLLAAVLSQAPATLKVAVVDVSAPDAIYEDVSRQLAAQVAEALTKAGVVAVRVDEDQLPPGGCRFGPCLGEVAKAQGADVVVTVDAEEVDEVTSRVAVTALWGTNGEPLAGGRYVARGLRKAPRALTKFAGDAVKQATARAAKGN
ncbi:MAG: hypothetical protein AB1730_08775 [Myxococcota bacterium]